MRARPIPGIGRAIPPERYVTIKINEPLKADAYGRRARGATAREWRCLISNRVGEEYLEGTMRDTAKEYATLYGEPIEVDHRATVTIPAGHALAGVWNVSRPARTWPCGTSLVVERDR